MNLPRIEDIDVVGKNIVVRADLEGNVRQRVAEEIGRYLMEKKAARIKIIGHKGNFQMNGVEVINDLRADVREEKNDEIFAAQLAVGMDVYVNEAFGTSHRMHASIDALPRLMRKRGKQVCVGIRFEKEVENLSKVLEMQGEKVLIIGGAKTGDKARLADELSFKFDKVLRGGLLPGVSLREDGLDISDKVIEEYKKEIATAGVIVVAGPMGKFEDPSAGSGQGTREVFTAVAESKVFRVAGGGDTENALVKFGLLSKFDWVSVGGGAMLEFLNSGILVGIKALTE